MIFLRQAAITVLFSLTLIYSKCYSQIYAYKNFTHRDGLSLDATWTIAEKPDGGILIGTQGAGIVEYDGYKFKDVIGVGEDNNHHVTGIAFWKNDIVFTSKFNGLFRVNEKGKVTLLYKGNGIGDVLNVMNYRNDLLLISSSQIYIYNPDKNSFKKISDFSQQGKTLAISQTIDTKKGFIFLTNYGCYIYTIDGRFKKLKEYFNTDSKLLCDKRYGYVKNGLLYLFDNQFEHGILIDLNEKVFNYEEKKITKNFDARNYRIIDAIINKKKNRFIFCSENGDLFEESNFNIKKIPNNSLSNNIAAHSIISDHNGDYWLATYTSGLFKIGPAPFTKVNFNEVFQDTRISYVYKTKRENVITSNYLNKTYICNILGGEVTTHNLTILSGTSIEDKLYFGALDGLYEFKENSNQFQKLTIQGIDPKKTIQFLLYNAPYVWLNVHGDGLYKLDKNFKILAHYKQIKYAPNVVYTGQVSDDGRFLYMGTPQGIKRLDIESEEFSAIDSHDLGYYSGLSVKDIFGTSWFTLEKGIIGISRQGEIFTLSDKKLFSSLLFYTLNSDNYGNLIIGTNKGLNAIQINERGKVLNRRNYRAGSGFEGHETHMRSSFQGNDFAIVGTVEGLYYLDFELLQHLAPPQKPAIYLISKVENTQSPIYNYGFISKNPKTKNVLYSYRIANHDNKWSYPSEKNEISLSNLKSGNYTLEVKATYDGAIYSPVTSYPIEVIDPFLRGNKLIIALIIVVVGMNVFFYYKTKNSKSFQLFYSDEFFISEKYAPLLVLFAAIAHITVNGLFPFISNDFSVNMTSVLLTGGILVVIFFNTLKSRNKGNIKGVKTNLVVGFVMITLFNIYSLYETSLHPFYGFSVILIGSVAPFIFEKTLAISLYTIGLISTTMAVLLFSEGINYDKFLLVIPIVISGLLSILLNFIRHDSLHQLAFISSIVNKGNVIAMAINKEGKLKYISKNIVNYIDVKISNIMDTPISFMNEFIPIGVDSRNIDVNTEFRDGKRFISPIQNRDNGITWMEWSCKEFSEDIRVLIGQDITEKINIQNTYEILVENAEDLIYQVDVDGNFQFLNNRFNEYLSFDKDILVGQNVAVIFPENYRKSLLTYYNNQLSKKEKVTYFEFPMYDQKNQLQWFGQYVTLLFATGNSDEVTGFLAVGRNITEKIKKDNIISTQSADIKASINYARRIQMNLLPSTEKIEGYFSESFVIYKPKDIVSGDFYWCNQSDDYLFVAVGDGTGHGVPGAFMSILGVNLLSSIIMEKQIYDPGRILDEMDKRLKSMLSEGNQEQKISDGMELTVCVFNEKKNTLEYACAGSKLIIHDGTTFSIRKGDSKHVGESHDDFQGYITHYNNIGDDITIYLFTDGFHDQFGGVQHKKYSMRRLLELFIQNISLPLKNQHKIIEGEFTSWKSGNDQTDDVTIVGLRKTKQNFYKND